MTQWAWKTIKRRCGECQQCFHCFNPQIKLPSQRSASLYGQKHIENPKPRRTIHHDVPVPKLAPVPCSAQGNTNPRVSVPSGCQEAHQRVTHSSQSPPLKSTTGKLPASLTAASQQLRTRGDPPVPGTRRQQKTALASEQV